MSTNILICIKCTVAVSPNKNLHHALYSYIRSRFQMALAAAGAMEEAGRESLLYVLPAAPKAFKNDERVLDPRAASSRRVVVPYAHPQKDLRYERSPLLVPAFSSFASWANAKPAQGGEMTIPTYTGEWASCPFLYNRVLSVFWRESLLHLPLHIYCSADVQKPMRNSNRKITAVADISFYYVRSISHTLSHFYFLRIKRKRSRERSNQPCQPAE